MQKSKNILILGETGFIGKQLLQFLAKNTNFNIVGLSRKSGLDLTIYDSTIAAAPPLITAKKPRQELYGKGLLNIKVFYES